MFRVPAVAVRVVFFTHFIDLYKSIYPIFGPLTQHDQLHAVDIEVAYNSFAARC